MLFFFWFFFYLLPNQYSRIGDKNESTQITLQVDYYFVYQYM